MTPPGETVTGNDEMTDTTKEQYLGEIDRN